MYYMRINNRFSEIIPLCRWNVAQNDDCWFYCMFDLQSTSMFLTILRLCGPKSTLLPIRFLLIAYPNMENLSGAGPMRILRKRFLTGSLRVYWLIKGSEFHESVRR